MKYRLYKIIDNCDIVNSHMLIYNAEFNSEKEAIKHLKVNGSLKWNRGQTFVILPVFKIDWDGKVEE